MASQADGMASPVTDMDFDNPCLPSSKEKKEELLHTDAEQEKGADAEDVQKKFNDVVLIGDERPDARLSVKPELRLGDLAMSMEDLTGTDAEGKTFALHRSKETQLEHCHLGGGSFGQVFKVNHKVHGVVAVKLANPGKEDKIKMYQKEVEKHVIALTSEQVISIKGFVQCDDEGCNCGLVGFVMTYMELGSLWEFRIKRWKDVPDLWPLTNRMVYEISLGMQFLHSKDIIHRDLKLENVLVAAHLSVKIADLGLATNLRTSAGDDCWGTNTHKPPEAFRTDYSTKVVTPKYDVYSFAMTLYQLLTGLHPYGDRDYKMIRKLKVKKKITPQLQPIPENAPGELIEVMKKSWSYEPRHRPDFTDITTRVGNLDTDPTHESLGVYLAQPSSIKKEGETASKVTKRVLHPNADDESVRRGMENITVNDHVSAKPRGSKTGPSSTPTTGTMISGQESGCQDDNVQSQTGARRSMGFTGLVIPSIQDPPGRSGFTSLRSDMGPDQAPGKWSETKHELLSNPPIGNKQEVYSPIGQTPSKTGLVQPDLSDNNKLSSRSGDRRPVPDDGRQGRTELAVGSMAGGTTYIHQKRSPVAQSQPSSSERDPIIVFDSTPPSDQDFEIKLKVRLTVPIRDSISSKLNQILSSLKRCKQRDYWPLTNNSLCTLFLSHEFTLQTLQLPPTVDEDQFTLFLRVSDKSPLERLHRLSKKDLLPSLLFPLFVHRHLEDVCRPVKPDLKVDQWEEQFNRGMEHFKKKDKAFNSQNQPAAVGEDLSNEFDIIVENIGHDWRQLARQLGLSEVDIECITEKHRRDLREQSRQALWTWKSRLSRNATRQALIGTLRKCRLNYIADIIEGFIKQ